MISRHAPSPHAAMPETPFPANAPDTTSALGRKLDQHRQLSRVEHDFLVRLLGRNVRSLRNRDNLIGIGERPTEIHVVVQGWAARYRTAPNGRRQITAFYLPGDVCDFNAFLIASMDSTIEAIDGLRIASIDQARFNGLGRERPVIAHGLWWESLSTAAIAREWMVSIAQRTAKQRVAHLLCELFTRLRVVGQEHGGTCRIPLTQADIGDACGMTPEHTNRTLRTLHLSGLIQYRSHMVRIIDWHALTQAAGFSPDYLHFEREIERQRATGYTPPPAEAMPQTGPAGRA